MRLKTRGRFAVTALLELAMRDGREPVPLTDISRRHKISLSYLEELFTKLRQRELVSSVRGPYGGYRLGMSLNQVSIADIVLAVDEPMDYTHSGNNKNCLYDDESTAHTLWENLNNIIFNYLADVTLQQLVDKQKKYDQ